MDTNILFSEKFICQEEEATVMGKFLCMEMLLKCVLKGDVLKKLQHVPLSNEICFKMYVQSQDTWKQVIEGAKPTPHKVDSSWTSPRIEVAIISRW